MFQARAEGSSRIIPGDEFDGPGVDIVQPTLNLQPPGLLRVRIDLGVQALQERLCQRRTSFTGKCERLFK
jgi:hypothetical protein